MSPRLTMAREAVYLPCAAQEESPESITFFACRHIQGKHGFSKVGFCMRGSASSCVSHREELPQSNYCSNVSRNLQFLRQA